VNDCTIDSKGHVRLQSKINVDYEIEKNLNDPINLIFYKNKGEVIEFHKRRSMGSHIDWIFSVGK